MVLYSQSQLGANRLGYLQTVHDLFEPVQRKEAPRAARKLSLLERRVCEAGNKGKLAKERVEEESGRGGTSSLSCMYRSTSLQHTVPTSIHVLYDLVTRPSPDSLYIEDSKPRVRMWR